MNALSYPTALPVVIALLFFAWANANGQSVGHDAESNICTVQNVMFTMTPGARAQITDLHPKPELACGTVTHVCCHIQGTQEDGTTRRYTFGQTGKLLNPEQPSVRNLWCLPNDSAPRFTNITWAVLEDVYGYDAIKGNNVPAECRLKAKTISTQPTSTSKKTSVSSQDNERRLIAGALNDSHGDTRTAAKKLGISENALLRKMKEVDIQTAFQ